MRVIIVDLYKILYSNTRAKWFSIWGAVGYVTLLNIITIQGLASLMEGWLSAMKYVKMVCRFPYVLLLALVLLSINYMLITPLKNLKKERQKQANAIPILVYTVACAILLFYTYYGSKL